MLLPVPQQRLDISFIVLDQAVYHVNHDCFVVYVRPANVYCLMFGPPEDPETLEDGMLVAIHYLGEQPWVPGPPSGEEIEFVDPADQPAMMGYMPKDGQTQMLTAKDLERLFKKDVS